MRGLLLLIVMMALAGCGSRDQATAATTAKSCSNAVEPSIVGVSLGMTPSDAKSAIECNNKDYKTQILSGKQGNETLETPLMANGKYPVDKLLAETPGASKKDIYGNVTVEDSTDHVIVTFIGLPGHEMASSITRVKDFTTDNAASYTKLAESLIAKYGQPTSVNDDKNGRYQAFWYYNSDRKILQYQSSQFQNCDNVLTNGYMDSGCGLLIRTDIPYNTDTSSSYHLNVSMLNSSKNLNDIKLVIEALKKNNVSSGPPPNL